MLQALLELPNGNCGCELAFSTFPRLLAKKDVTPGRNYVEEWGMPMSNGQQAATVKQRKAIWNTLEGLGHKMWD